MDRITGKPIEGLEYIRQSIGDILSTPIGTRLCLRDYGSHLPELLDQPANALTRLRIYAATALAISRQEPRIRLTRVSLAALDTPGAWQLDLVGTSTNAGAPDRPVSFSLPVRALSALA